MLACNPKSARMGKYVILICPRELQVAVLYVKVVIVLDDVKPGP